MNKIIKKNFNDGVFSNRFKSRSDYVQCASPDLINTLKIFFTVWDILNQSNMNSLPINLHGTMNTRCSRRSLKKKSSLDHTTAVLPARFQRTDAESFACEAVVVEYEVSIIIISRYNYVF
jgi:hypothetical protein